MNFNTNNKDRYYQGTNGNMFLSNRLHFNNIKSYKEGGTATLDEDSDEFNWSDFNPFEKGAWDRNWDNAVKNFIDSFKSIPDIWKEGENERKKMYDDVPRTVIESKKNTGVLARSFDKLGDVFRSGNAILGGTVGSALQLLLPKKVEKGAEELGLWLDLGKDINFIRSFFNPGEEEIFPDDPENEGFADEHFAWSGLDKRQRQNLNDAARFITAIFGIRGMKNGASKLRSGVSGMARDGVGTTLKHNWKPIIIHTPVGANFYEAGAAFNSARRAVAPKKWGGAEGFGRRSLNAGGAAFHGFLASDPIMALYPYIHSSYMVGLPNE